MISAVSTTRRALWSPDRSFTFRPRDPAVLIVYST